MKIFTLSILSILLISTFGMAQSIGVFGGLTGSSFEENPVFESGLEASNGFEVGAAFVFDALPIIEAGVEYTKSVSPFEIKTKFQGIEFTQKNSQSMFGAFVKFNLSVPVVTPYLRAGAGYYSGSSETNLPDALKDVAGLDTDYKSTLGFNVGAGVDTFIGLNAEFVYHIVSKELDITDAKSLGANYWGLRVGYYFSLL
ncbi:MAG: hypothetical protein KAT05_06295 [Spirochaetes bacterium]|nr:hypothetical protein [Spirochaetota bacterium]